MWPLAIFLALVVGFYWFAFMATLWFCFNGLMALWAGHFIRASIWASLGVGMILWWNGTATIPHPQDVEAWLQGSAWVVGFGTLLTFTRFCHRHRRAQATAPLETTPIVDIQHHPRTACDRAHTATATASTPQHHRSITWFLNPPRWRVYVGPPAPKKPGRRLGPRSRLAFRDRGP